MREIVQIGDDVLRKKALEVSLSDIKGREIQKIINGMTEALEDEEDGVAIAAPQIGYSKRIFIVSEKAFEEDEKSKQKVFINPKIVSSSKEKVILDEGCLSVRWKYGKVERAEKVKVEAYDKDGKKFERGASGLLAQIFQHETDHLDGILFIDKANELQEYKPEDIKNEN